MRPSHHPLANAQSLMLPPRSRLETRSMSAHLSTRLISSATEAGERSGAKEAVERRWGFILGGSGADEFETDLRDVSDVRRDEEVEGSDEQAEAESVASR